MSERQTNLGRIAASLPECIFLVTSDGRIIDANQAAAVQFGQTRAALCDLDLGELLDDSQGDVKRFLTRCSASGTAIIGRLVRRAPAADSMESFRCTGGVIEPASAHTAATVFVRLTPTQESTRQFRLLTDRIDALGREVELRLRAEQVLDAQRKLLQMIAEDRTLEDVLTILTSFIDSTSKSGGMSSVLLLDAKTGTLRHGAAPSLPFDYCAAIDGISIGPSVGSCGTAAFLNENVYVEDIESDARWEGFARVAINAGLRACFSTPITGGDNEVLGTFALYYSEARKLDPSDEQLIGLMARSAALAIERKRAANEIRDLLERERLARDEAEEANRSKDEFLALVSHELRNPLNAILGWARVLTMDSSDAETLSSGLSAIERNADLQAHLINEILDYSRIKAGKLRMEPEATEIGELVRATVESAGPNAAARHVALQFESEIDEPLILSVDPTRIQQVVNNIVGNALKFTPRDGKVLVRLSADNKYVKIEIEDTGCGIEPAFLPHIFDRFRQQDGTKQRKHEGLGLGLAIVREVVDLHKGRVSVHSDGPERGARFTVRLPRKRRGLTVPADAKDGMPLLNGIRILAVDDAPDTRALLRTLFTAAGAVIEVAAGGNEALDRLAAQRPDVLLCDIGMPGMDGYELISRLRARDLADGHPHLPAIALTAYARGRDRKRALEAGFDGHMAKPIDPEELLRVVAETAEE